MTGPLEYNSPASNPLPSAPGAPAAPLPPSVTLTVVKSAAGNSLFVQWQNLPTGTTALNIFRGKAGATSTWMLWKTLTITPGELADGSINLDLSTEALDGYSFYVQAAEGADNAGDGQMILWISSSTTPAVTTSTSSNGQQNPEDNTQPQSSTASSSSPTEPSPPQNPSSSSSSSGAGANNTPSSTQGDAYYNPEVQITGYGTAPGSFWVEHVNQNIEIGWQNIPANVNTILVARSASSTGPWGTIITQQNPGENGSYSLRLVDNSLKQTYIPYDRIQRKYDGRDIRTGISDTELIELSCDQDRLVQFCVWRGKRDASRSILHDRIVGVVVRSRKITCA